jgi:hypothetical protein
MIDNELLDETVTKKIRVTDVEFDFGDEFDSGDEDDIEDENSLWTNEVLSKIFEVTVYVSDINDYGADEAFSAQLVEEVSDFTGWLVEDLTWEYVEE